MAAVGLDPMPAAGLAALARAAVEARRCRSPQRAWLDEFVSAAAGSVEATRRAAVSAELDRLWPTRGEGRAGGAAPAAASAAPGGTSELLRQKASLELKLQAEAQKLQELERALRREQDEHRQAVESLSLQQKRIRELSDERARLLGEVSELESKLRVQISETEQAQLKFEKLKASRQLMGDQATEQLATINALREENERLRRQMEEMLRERDRKLEHAQAAAAEAASDTAEAAFGRLWNRMHAAAPEVFIATHVPNEKTFERLADAVVEMLRAFVVLEMHTHHFLKDLRQVGSEGDKLSHFYLMFTKNPGLLETLRDFLVSGKRSGNFTNLLRAHQVWARAFSSGLYKVIVRSPVILAEELNWRNWPIKSSFTTTEEAAIGKYYKETAQKMIPEKVGTDLRKHAADMAYEDYNDLMKRK